MENKQTRWFYNDNVDSKEYMEDKKNKTKKFLRFITRCNISDSDTIRSIPGFEGFICDRRSVDKCST